MDLSRPFVVGEWTVEPSGGFIMKGETKVHLEPRVMDVLVFMASKPGEVISREEIESAVWKGMVVSYDAITNAMIKLRKAFNDDARNPRIILTVAKRGYKLIAKVKVVDSAELYPDSHVNSGKSNRSYQLVFSIASLFILAVMISLMVFEFQPENSKPDIKVQQEVPSVIVLPFDNLSNDPEQQYFSDGITDDLIIDLSKLSGVSVIARTTAFSYRGKDINARKLGEEHHLKYVLEGSVRKASGHIRVTAQLTDSQSGLQIWGERYDRELKDIFQVQDDVRKKIIAAMSLTLTEDEHRRFVSRYTNSVDAYDVFLRGRAFLGYGNKEANHAGRDYLKKAIEFDRLFTQAYSSLAISYVDELRFGWSVDKNKSTEQAIIMAKKALQLDEQLPQAHWVLGYIDLFVRQDHENAIRSIKRALKLYPGYPDALGLLAISHVYAGNYTRAKMLIKQAMRLFDGDYPSQYANILGFSLLLSGDYENASTYLSDAIEKNPNRIQPNVYMVVCFMRQGKTEDARWQVEQLKLIEPGFSLKEWGNGQPFKDKAVLISMMTDLEKAGL